jgi:dolichol-phosphate mannosyltransferase
MPDDAPEIALPLHRRVRHGIRHPHNWFQLVRYGVVGASGYVVNLIVFTLTVHPLGVPYQVAAVAAFLVSVLNNFWWNRHWTFGAREGAFAFSYLVLIALVEGIGLPKVLAQAISIVAATPLSFLGQKLWSFRT